MNPFIPATTQYRVGTSHAARLAGNDGCCTTNLFGSNIERGSWSPNIDGTGDDDGGEQLGQCEGFPIEGTAVDIRLKNEGGDAVCLDEFQFFGGRELGSSTRDIPFIQCNPTCQIWAENVGNTFLRYGYNPKSWCEGNKLYHDWTSKVAGCRSSDTTIETVKKIALMTCPGRYSGSRSKIKAIIENVDGDRCTTDAFKSNPIQPGHYIESSNMGQACQRTPLKNKEAKASRCKFLLSNLITLSLRFG